MNDKAIEFEALKFDTLKIMQKMEDAGLNISKIKKTYDDILNETSNKNQTIPESIVNSQTNFATDCLVDNYSTAIKKLNLLYNELQKYEIYIKVSTFTEYVKSFIEKNSNNKEDYKTFRESIIDILNKLVMSNTLDYGIEGNIIENMYSVTYDFIKREFLFLGHSETLDYLKNNSIHVSYLDKQIIKELETLDLKNPKYKRIV